MKGRNLCYGLLLVLLIIFGLSFVGCSDTSALKYAYSAFPLYSDVFYSNDIDNSFDFTFGTNFRMSFNISNDVSVDDYHFRSRLLNDDTFTICNSSMALSIFSDTFIPNRELLFNVSGSFRKEFFVPTSNYPRTSACEWDYDSFYTASYNISDGSLIKLVNLNNTLFDDSTSGSISSYRAINSMTIPLYLSDDLSYIPANTPLSWEFGIVSDSSAVSFESSYPVKMWFSYSTDSTSSEYFSSSSLVSTIDNPISCSIEHNKIVHTYADDGWIDFRGDYYTCNWTPSTDIYYLHPVLSINDGSLGSKFVTFGFNNIYFSGSYLITDNDDTWSGQYANNQPTGDNVSNSPGYHNLFGYPDSNGCVSGDFLCDLSNLFSFGFLNPFAAIFDLFNDNSSCAYIPTISSMIHSNEVTVCPWFSTNVRNIVTPVLGLSSMMLVVGFAIRWLGSRSGNFIEDSGGIDSGGFHFENKFRRKH